MNFDRVAPYYRHLETLVFGHQLQEARVAFVRQIHSPRRVLVVGEGNGRFLAEFVRAHPQAEIDCIEPSARMIALARERATSSKVHFIHADLRNLQLERATYDLVVTHFLLDCFDQSTLPAVIEKLSHAAAANAQWLIADFFEPPRGWKRFRARGLIALMYRFFRLVARIEADCLVDYRPLLRRHGFVAQQARDSPDEMIRSELWERVSG